MIENIAIVPTAVLLLVLLSEYFLIMVPRKKLVSNHQPPVSIIVPAYNEEDNVEGCVKSLAALDYPEKEIIFVENGSSDSTLDKLKSLSKKYPIKVYSRAEAGKSEAINLGIDKASYDTIVVADADSHPSKESLGNLVKPLEDKTIGAVAGVVRVRNKKNPLTWFQSVEYAYFSFFNSITSKVNGIIFTPGVMSAYSRKALEDVGLFPHGTAIEDFAIALKLHDAGYKVTIADDAVSYTKVPTTFRTLFRQRRRWAKGVIQTTRAMRHMVFARKNKIVGFYSLPLLNYWFIHAAVMFPIIMWWVFSGYFNWFVMNSAAFSFAAARYFFNWFSLFGIGDLTYQIAAGNIGVTVLMGMSIAVTFLSYGFYLISVAKYDKRVGIRELVAVVFFFPYILFISFVQITALTYIFTKGKIKWR